LWTVLVVAAYIARPWSCSIALQLERRPADHPYHSVDPHGFGVMGSMFSALLFAAPVLWLPLQRRPEVMRAPAGTGLRLATLVVIGTPMMFQIAYLWLPLAASWPAYAAVLCWFSCVALVCFGRSANMPSINGAYARAPYLAWTVVIAIGAAKAGIILMALR
jgi:hypothetical protein